MDRLGSAYTGRPCAIYDEECVFVLDCGFLSQYSMSAHILVHASSIDVELPIAVDDEYWDPPDPKDAWKQPSGKPAIAEHFRAMLKLLEILTFTLRTVVRIFGFVQASDVTVLPPHQYSSNKSKLMLGLVGPSWEQRVVSEIDSALNKWIDSLPDHCACFPSFVCLV
jgi:hypothetical protein